MLRDRTSGDDARNQINAQMSLNLKRAKANIVIDNTGSQEKFKSVLFEVTKPLTWIEFWLPRQGAPSALVSIIVGVLMFRKVYDSDSELYNFRVVLIEILI
ncbi:putative dephospho-CoA kinase [Rosa chinensis]|uniref:Putative dephospho-CoA kinase n=1 Tax=Rosa chinensis TaxID=74649 RepID=A0A2P6QXH3_ROSCH|nr:putative dephospho-CoA kinase [Rosa chinensis]